ncbi:MAG: TetR/AcrR family transcriptional regulator [Nocardioides sp.]|uniref:TetR/AcrR family transcriptional regulator n=1 Tax=Nocardioides sp. TaxID=35761 RepID=UPI0039E65B80
MSSASTPRRRSPRGSGEQLRAEIIAAARALMAAAPSADAVSIRAVAKAVGVTPPSLYLHFEDKDALLSAVVIDVFDELDAAMVAAGADAPSALQRLRAYGVAYVRFAVEHPEHYRLATMDPCARPDVDSVLQAGAWTHFNEAVTACMDAGVFPAGDPVAVTLDLWSAAHGLAALQIAKPFLPWGGTLEEVTSRVLAAAALGHTVPDPEAALESP